MKRLTYGLIVFAGVVTVGTLVTWLATGRHYYTKFEIVENVEVPLEEDDPLAGTGFYDEDAAEVTVTRDEFHLGLLPTPQRLLDRHALSVISILGSTWGVCLTLLWWLARRKRWWKRRPP